MEAELNKAKEQLQQKQQQMEVVLHSVNGGVKSSNDDDTYSYAYISEELPGMFGYTMEEFKKFTGNNAMGMVYPPDLPGLWLTATNVLRTEILLTRQNTACPVKTAA